MFNYRKRILAVAVVAALSQPASAEADTITMSWSGALTMLRPAGDFGYNSDISQCYPGMVASPTQCVRTEINGTLSLDTLTGAGSGSVAPILFDGPLVVTSLSLQTVGNGTGGSGPLILGNMLWDWLGSNGIPVSIVWDASGLLSAVAGGLSVGQVITGGTLPASDNTDIETDYMTGDPVYPIGPAVMATTTWNTTDVGAITIGTDPSGTLPLIADTVFDYTNADIGIGGSPMRTSPAFFYHANIDILSAQVTSIQAVPIPATVWLFGSGLAGLIGIARRKRWNTDRRHDA